MGDKENKHTLLTFLAEVDSFLARLRDFPVLWANWPTVSQPCRENHHVSIDSHQIPVTPASVQLP